MLKNKDNLYGQLLYNLTDGQTGKDLDLRLSAFGEFIHDRKDGHRLSKILKAYSTLYDQKKGITRAGLRVKTSLAFRDRESLLKQLTAKVGGPIELVEIIDPTVVGGVKIKIGDQIIDGSFRTALDQLVHAF